MSSDVRLCGEDEVSEGEAKGFPAGPGPRDKIIVLRREGRLLGWRDDCPHGFIPLGTADRGYFNYAKTHLVCYGHGALFLADTGLCVWGPCEGKSLASVPLTLRDGAVWAPAR